MDEILSSEFLGLPESQPDATACRAPESFPDIQIQPEDPKPEVPKQRLVKAKRATGLPRLKKPKHRLGKPKLPEHMCRVQVSVRVTEQTKKKLLKLQAKNLGWAIDKLVMMAEDRGLFKIPVELI